MILSFSAGFDFPHVDIFRVGVQGVQRVSSAHISAAAASETLLSLKLRFEQRKGDVR